MLTVYVSIGNSDDELSQAEWSKFAYEVDMVIRRSAERVHGEWYSPGGAAYQNACWCFEVGMVVSQKLRRELAEAGSRWRQKAVTWAVAEVEFLP